MKCIFNKCKNQHYHHLMINAVMEVILKVNFEIEFRSLRAFQRCIMLYIFQKLEIYQTYQVLDF